MTEGGRDEPGTGEPGSRVIAFATWLLALLGAGLMYVSFDAQYQFNLTSAALCGPFKEDDDQPAC